MRAVICKEYGGPEVLEMADVPQPEPKPGEVLLKVHASAVGFGDMVARDFRIPLRDFWLPAPLWLIARLSMGWSKPRVQVFGGQLAGEIEAVGADVTTFQPGDKVWAYPGQRFGGHAEYATISAKGMIGLKPDNLTFAEAACVPYGATTCLSLLSKAEIQPGQRVLINGAAGGLGSWAVQIANHQGAHITGVCSSAKMDYVKNLGADQVLDYTVTKFWESATPFDVVLDTTLHATWDNVRQVLTPSGRYLRAVFRGGDLWRSMTTARGKDGPRLQCVLSSESPAELETARQLVESGALRPVIDGRYSLTAAAHAHARVASGQHIGHVVLILTDDADRV